MNDKKIKTYKGFNPDLTCKGFQYEVGKIYEHDGPVKAGKRGFHAYEYPMGVLKQKSPTRAIGQQPAWRGEESNAIVTGRNCRAKGQLGNWLVLTERDSDRHMLGVKRCNYRM